VRDRLTLLPDFSDGRMALSVFIIPIAVQWWSVWYPGAEPGGGGYIAQRMLAAKSERHAVGATLLFNVAHYALRPWPWILVALASLVVFPDLASLRDAFPEMAESRIKNDLAYPAMLTFLPHGLLGVVLASLLAAYMSTIATHLNWGSSYVVNDFHKRFVRPEASERELVFVGRLATLILMILSAALALWLENALQAFDILLQVGAGTGLLFILRWFWWRINAFSELTAMIVSFLVAVVFQLFGPRQLVEWFPGVAQWAGYASLPEELPAQFPDWFRLCTGVAITTCAWVAVTLITPPTSPQRLRAFYRLIRPGGPGWARVVDAAARDGEQLEPTGGGWNVPLGLLCAAVGCLAVYSALFATGYWIYGNTVPAVGLTVVATVATVVLTRLWRGVLRGSE
jgi:Na+/proline symporter